MSASDPNLDPPETTLDLSDDAREQLARLRADMKFISADQVEPRRIADRYVVLTRLGAVGWGSSISSATPTSRRTAGRRLASRSRW
ncbi:MAG: hypothetical protein HC927_01395 [Deltaproteobacteria bacterium]|nr:hypothetical protein [Deltaproteobacteria bacterium]